MGNKVVIIDCDMNMFVRDMNGNLLSQVHNDDIEELLFEIRVLFNSR